MILSAAMIASVVTGCSAAAEDTTPAAETTEAAAEETEEAAPEEATEEASSDITYAGDLEIMHYSTSEESEGNGAAFIGGNWDDVFLCNYE